MSQILGKHRAGEIEIWSTNTVVETLTNMYRAGCMGVGSGPNTMWVLMPENAKAGAKKEGGGQNLTSRPPTENSFRPPSPRYVLPPPYSVSLSNFLSNAQNLPQNSFWRVSKNGFRRPSSRGFAFGCVLPTPLLALPSDVWCHNNAMGKQNASKR